MKSLAKALFSALFLTSFGFQAAVAATGEEISGGGQLVELDMGYKISFGVYGLDNDFTGPEGSLEINFHNVGTDAVDKTKFNGEQIVEMNFLAGNTDHCNAAMNMVVYGSYEGEPGYSVILRAADFGAPGSWGEAFDTVRIQLFDYPVGSAQVFDGELYDTSDGDFPDQTNCQGSQRSKLDRGNITIEME